MRLRTRPVEQAGGIGANSWLGFNGIGQPPDLFDINGDDVSGFEPAGRIRSHSDPVRRSCQNRRARKQRGAAAQKLDDRGDIEDHVVRIPVLDRNTI